MRRSRSTRRSHRFSAPLSHPHSRHKPAVLRRDLPRASAAHRGCFYFTIGVALGGVIIYRFFLQKAGVYRALWAYRGVFAAAYRAVTLRHGRRDIAVSPDVRRAADGLWPLRGEAARHACRFCRVCRRAAGAVKYPLVIFAAIPAFAAVRLMRGARAGGSSRLRRRFRGALAGFRRFFRRRPRSTPCISIVPQRVSWAIISARRASPSI